MKNIHVLPTDKPSRVFITNTKPIADNLEVKVNICITNDEEIKDGDWCYYENGDLKGIHKVVNGQRPKTMFLKKIILTTDQDLIKDGVQSIDDEFLEWFVRNPNCEEVETIKVLSSKYGYSHLLIIPKEEPNREITFEEVFGEEKKKDLKEFIDKHKKETLDEAVERLFNYHSNNTSLAEGHYDYMMDKEDFKQASYELVKWQQEQDKNKFSAEEVRRIAEWSFHFYKTNEFDDDELEAEWSRILDNNLKKK